MALINCPECGKGISDKATSCPNCGMPLSQVNTTVTTPKLESKPVASLDQPLICPESFPKDLRIGQQITNWNFDASLEGVYDQAENTITNIPSGKVSITLHSHGVRVWRGLTMYDIHNSQIINIVKTTSTELIKANKSVIGRAIVGGLIVGPLGAIIGGMSALQTSEKLCTRQYVVINFWDATTRTPQSILIQCDPTQPVKAFIARQKKENAINISQKRTAEEEHMPIWGIICIIVIIISIIIIFTV